MNQKRIVGLYLTLSIIGASLLIIISLFLHTETKLIYIYDKMLVGGAFISSCLFGISLALRPGWIARLTKEERQRPNNPKNHGGTRKHLGHHPDCKGFETHIINVKKRILCAACTGLALGSIVSIFLMGLYIALPIGLSPIVLIILIMFGMAFIALNYLEYIRPSKTSLSHLISNVTLVVGFFLVVVGVFHITGNVFYGIIGVVISFLWLDTRIQISKWRHSEICQNCTKTCKTY